MTVENLKLAQELLPKIAKAKENIDRWEKAVLFNADGNIACKFQSQSYSYVNVCHIPFDVAKALSIAGYKKELEQLEKEFNSL